jgi:hypothetical protein
MTSAADDAEALALLRPPPASHERTRFLMLRGLGLVYLVAFVSMAQQIAPLVGPHGLLPAEPALEVARSEGLAGVLRAPTLFLVIPASDAALRGLAWLGAALALAVTIGASNALLMAALWVLHLSFVVVGDDFWGFGWELMLAEAGFLAIFLAPLRSITPFAASRAPLSPIPIVLNRWLLFRVMLGAGLIKMRGDPCWRELTCLDTFYETQPFPSPLSPLWHFAPTWVHRLGVVVNHVVELVVPFGFFGPARVRLVAGLLTIAFQAMLILGGNLSYLNWLTIVIAIACFDDAQLARIGPRLAAPTAVADRATRITPVVLACVIVILSVDPALNLLSRAQRMNASFDPLHLVSTYGAFGSVQTERLELSIEGSDADDPDDDASYRRYELPCAPSDPMRRPCFVAPYPLRLDWQIWFAAMEDDPAWSPWLVHLVARLLEGDRATLALFSRVPFDHPPRWVRIRRFRYRFAREGPAWWERELDDPDWMRPLDRDDAHLRRYLETQGW